MGVCLEWSAGQALAAGASEDEIAEVLLAIAPMPGLGRVVCAATEVAAALVLSAVAGQSTVNGLARHIGLNQQAAAEVGHLFTSSTTVRRCHRGHMGLLGTVRGCRGRSDSAALPAGFRSRSPGERYAPRADLAGRVLAGRLFVSGLAGPWVRDGAGPVLLAVIGLVVFTGFWWFTMWFLLAGRISWRNLLPCAVAMGVFWVGMEAVFLSSSPAWSYRATRSTGRSGSCLPSCPG